MKNEKGFVLITSFLFAAVLSTVSLGLATRQLAYLQAGENNKNRMVAFNMAEAGLDLALVQLVANSNYGGTTGFTSLSTGNSQGGYSISVCPPACTGVTAPTDANTRLIVATGQSPSNNTADRAYESRKVTAYANVQPKSPFLYSVFGGQSISLNGSPSVSTDSYNSANGAYDPAWFFRV